MPDSNRHFWFLSRSDRVLPVLPVVITPVSYLLDEQRECRSLPAVKSPPTFARAQGSATAARSVLTCGLHWGPQESNLQSLSAAGVQPALLSYAGFPIRFLIGSGRIRTCSLAKVVTFRDSPYAADPETTLLHRSTESRSRPDREQSHQETPQPQPFRTSATGLSAELCHSFGRR